MDPKSELRGADVKIAQVDEAGFLPPAAKLSPEPLKRGHNTKFVTIDESGYVDSNGKMIYTATYFGESRLLIDADGLALDVNSIDIADQLNIAVVDGLGIAAERAAEEAAKSPEQKQLERACATAFDRQDSQNNQKVIAHKRGVVKTHKKLVRKQLKAAKLKQLQSKAFTNGK